MGQFAQKYSRDQKDACATAYVDRRLTAREVQNLARDGHLTLNGQQLEPFEIALAMIYDSGKRLRRQRKGELATGLTDVPHEDAIESLRKRLVSMVDKELARLERAQPKGRLDIEYTRQLARAMREIKALGGPGERPPKPGQRDPKTQQHADGHTVGGLAGQIISSAGRSNEAETAPERPSPQHTQAETRAEEPSTAEPTDQTNGQTEPGSSRRAAVLT